MVNSGFLKRIMVVGEKHVLGEMTGYMDMALEATGLLYEMLDTNQKRMLEINELNMRWVTREKAKVDRIACPWLI